MAILTDIRRLNVGKVFASGVDAVVATETTARDVVVIEEGGNPARGGVAVVAVVTASDVVGVFACRNGPVMTGSAGTQYLQMIYARHRCK